jgi:hypothetical protein
MSPDSSSEIIVRERIVGAPPQGGASERSRPRTTAKRRVNECMDLDAPFIRSSKRAQVLGSDVGRVVVRLSRPGLRLYVVRASGLRFDSCVLSCGLRARLARYRSTMQVVLKGRLVVRRATELSVGPGQGIAEWHHEWDERWCGDEFEVLVVEWGEAIGERAPVIPSIFDLPASPLSTLADLGRCLLKDAVVSRARLDSVQSALGELGVRLVPFRSLPPAPSFGQPAASALSKVFSNLQKASHVQIAEHLGCTQRHTRRVLEQVAPWIDADESIGRFREALRAERVQAAAQLLTAKGPSLEEVSSSVGYGSVRAMLRAFEALGVASPSRIRRLVGS